MLWHGMEVVLDMKLTDIAIVFQLFFICLITVLHIRSLSLYANSFANIMYDNVMDGIVEDSLRAGYKTVDTEGKPLVMLEDIRKCFLAETSLYNVWAEYLLLYVDIDGFVVWNPAISNVWEDKIFFSEAEKTSHEQKIYEITEYMRLKWGFVLSIPYNGGESFKNTIEDYTLIAISYNQTMDIQSFSGAKIHKK